MTMPGRNYNAGSGYRYGFNGKENDKNISEGDLDFGARIYDSRLGRFLSVDPYYASFPHQTPYSFAANCPISHIDKDGKFAQWIIQYGVNVGINLMTQMLTAYMFDPNVNSWGQAWDKTSVWQAFGEGAVDMIGTKKLKMAANAVMGMATYVDQVGFENVTGSGLVGSGLIGLLEPIIGDAIAKYGSKAALMGLRKMGLDISTMRKLGFRVNNFSLGSSFENRHVASRIKPTRTAAKEKTTVALKGVNYKQDLTDINDGLAEEIADRTYGTVYELKNGNKYFIKEGKITPMAGGGYVDLSRGGTKVLGILNQEGLNSKRLKEGLGKEFSQEDYNNALDVYNKSK